MKAFSTTLIFVAMTFTGCAQTAPAITGESTVGLWWSGQWRPARTIGADRYLVEGYDTDSALAGGAAHCAKTNRKIEVNQIVPHTSYDPATITFTCR